MRWCPPALCEAPLPRETKRPSHLLVAEESQPLPAPPLSSAPGSSSACAPLAPFKFSSSSCGRPHRTGGHRTSTLQAGAAAHFPLGLSTRQKL